MPVSDQALKSPHTEGIQGERPAEWNSWEAAVMPSAADSLFRWVLALRVCVCAQCKYLQCEGCVPEWAQGCDHVGHVFFFNCVCVWGGGVICELCSSHWGHEVKGHLEHYITLCAVQHKAQDKVVHLSSFYTILLLHDWHHQGDGL